MGNGYHFDQSDIIQDVRLAGNKLQIVVDSHQKVTLREVELPQEAI